jgi:urease accessory protein
MRASAALVAEIQGDGSTRLTGLRGEPPLLLRRTGTTPDGTTLVYLVGGAAGPLAGDLLALTVDLGPGARVEIRSVAATIALPGRPAGQDEGDPAGWSRLDLTVRIGAGAELRWLPEPLIAAAGCRHTSRAVIDVAASGRLTWRDEIVCGRHGEQPGDLRTELDVRYAGRPLLVHDLAIGPDAPGWAGAAVLNGARAVGSLLVVGETSPTGTSPTETSPTGTSPAETSPAETSPTDAGPYAATMPLAGPGVLTVAVAADPADLRARLEPAHLRARLERAHLRTPLEPAHLRARVEPDHPVASTP